MVWSKGQSSSSSNVNKAVHDKQCSTASKGETSWHILTLLETSWDFLVSLGLLFCKIVLVLAAAPHCWTWTVLFALLHCSLLQNRQSKLIMFLNGSSYKHRYWYWFGGPFSFKEKRSQCRHHLLLIIFLYILSSSAWLTKIKILSSSVWRQVPLSLQGAQHSTAQIWVPWREGVCGGALVEHTKTQIFWPRT